ncbi:MAG: tetratricopeptide repeat protein [Gammaproteobacteria bacterium]|nr:tetratricopeptide repeat protein [Gammaproteobacteria bacterium]
MQVRKSLLILSVALLLAACGSPEQRAAEYLDKAQKLYDDGDFVKARIEAQNAAQLEPKNAKARYILALVAEEEKQYQQMFGHLTVAVDSDPSNVEARLKLGTLYFLGQSWDDAAKQVEELMKLAPDDARVHLLNARVLIQKQDQAGGLAEIDTALKLDPDYVDAILLRSAADAMESIDKGLASLETAIDRLPADKTRPLRELRVIMLAQGKRMSDVEVSLRSLSEDFPEEQAYQVQLAQFYTSQGRVDEADQLLKKFTEADPTDAEKQLGYVQFLATQRDAERAEAALKSFIELNPDAGKLRLALGQLFEGTERADEARKVYAELGKRDPKSAEGMAARNRVAAIDIRAGKVEEGRAEIDRILTDAPDDANALLLRAGLRYADNKFDDAIADLRLVLRKEADNERALLLLAQAYLRKEDVVLAKDTYRRLLEVSPDSPEGLQQLAALYTANKDYADAEALLRKRLEKQPDDLISSGRLVEVLMSQGETAKAEAEARRMTELANQSGVGDFSLGRVLATKKDYNAAADAFRKSVAVRAGDPLPLEGLVRSLLAADKKAEAINALNEQLEAEDGQNKLFAKYLLGNIYAQEGDAAKAEKNLEEVLKEKPESVAAWATLAGLEKERDARISVYKRALKAVPGSIDLNMLLATEYEQANRFDDAAGVYEEVLKADSTYEPAINNLAALLLDRRTDKDSHARALKLAQSLSKTDNPAMLDTLGWAHYRAGQYSEAVSVLERVVAKAGGFAIFRYHLGMAYFAAGNTVGAKQELTEALAKEGDYPGRDEARATLAKL